jgi:nitroimidazol reductase NimA-like FMN-containing flavoprotein (pyridoxamine 5'-phosphate oxidase superfamily)
MTIGLGPITELTPDDCWSELDAHTLGRLAVTAAGTVDIFPVNYASSDRMLYFRTAPGTKLLELAINDRVAFEIDGFTETEAWSVVVKGRAERLELQSEIDAADRLPLAPWLPTLKYRWVRVIPVEVSGRRFSRGPEPERY